MSENTMPTANEDGSNVSGTSHPVPEVSTSSTSATPRTQRACSSCSKQKIRCDGQKPCARCIVLGHQSGCVYLPSLRGKTRKRKDRPGEPNSSRITLPVRSNRGVGGGEGSTGTGSSAGALSRERDFAMHKWNTGVPKTATASLWPREDISVSNTLGNPSTASFSITSPVGTATTFPLPGDAPNPLAALAEACATTREGEIDQQNNTSSSVAQGDSDRYYAPIARVMRNDAPHILNFISVQEAEQLFDIYFRSLHPHFPILDRENSSPVAVARRNNFLFNAICCVAARNFHVVLWERINRGFARFEMERLPKDKCIEVVQGHLIYAQWNLIRPKHFEEDMTWLRIGLAVRTAIDINIHRVALLRQSREGMSNWVLRNILRTWLACYIVDRTVSSQLGKPPSVRGENGIRSYLELVSQSETGKTVDDVWVAALAEWTLILSRSIDVFKIAAGDHTSSLARNFGSQTTALPDVVQVFSRQLSQWREKSINVVKAYDANSRRYDILLANITLYELYARLILHSHGLHRANESAETDLPAALLGYHGVAVQLIRHFDDAFDSRGYTRGCPDFLFTVLTYGAVSLLKIISVPVEGFETITQSILDLARRASDILAQAAVTRDHLPASQSALVTRLIEKSSAATKTADQVDYDFNQIIASMSTNVPSTGNDSSAVPFPDATAAQPVQLDFTHFNQNGDTTLSGQLNASSWFEPLPFNPLAPFDSDAIPNDPYSQDQDFFFSHESLWPPLLDNSMDRPVFE